MQIKTIVAIPTDTHSEQLPQTKQPANDGEDRGERKTFIYSIGGNRNLFSHYKNQ